MYKSRFCKKCGWHSSESARFCNHCGEAFERKQLEPASRLEKWRQSIKIQARSSFQALVVVGKKSPILIISFLALSAILTVFGLMTSVSAYVDALLVSNITIAVFAINFSFVEYQLFPYRALLRTAPSSQVFLSAVILLATLFVFGIVTGNVVSPVAALTFLPLVGCAGLLLGKIARYEGSPSTMLEKEASEVPLRVFLRRYVSLVEERQQEFQDLGIEEWPLLGGWHQQLLFLSPSVKIRESSDLRDPFHFLVNLGIVAIENHDIHIFEQVVEQALESLDMIELDYPSQQAQQVNKEFIEPRTRMRLVEIVRSTVLNLSLATIRRAESDLFATQFMNICAEYILRETDKIVSASDAKNGSLMKFWSGPGVGFIMSLMDGMSTIVEDLLSHGNDQASLIPIFVALNAADKGAGMRGMPERGWSLSFTDFVKVRGKAAIELHEAEYVYQCLNTLQKLSVAALQAQNYYFSDASLQGIVQLGRESRATGLQTSRGQSLYDVAKWSLDSVAATSRKNLLNLSEMVAKENILGMFINIALSRLNGVKYNTIVERENGDFVARFERTENHYKEQRVEGFPPRRYDVDYAILLPGKDVSLQLGVVVEQRAAR